MFTCQEANDPARSVPRAIILELLVVGAVYIGAAVGMLYLIPYYLIDLRAPLPSAFEHNGVTWGKVIVTVGPLFGITNLQMLGVYGFSRILYRMAKDGLIFQWFLKVNERTGIPLNSVLFVGAATSISALLFDLSYIVKVTVILMLLNYMIVGSALIRLKITECNKMKLGDVLEQPVAEEAQRKFINDFYDHEVLVSEYETCESAESPDLEAAGQDAPASKEGDALIDFNSEPADKGSISAARFQSSEEATAASRGEKYLPEGNTENNILIDFTSEQDKLKAVQDGISVPKTQTLSVLQASADAIPGNATSEVPKRIALGRKSYSKDLSNNCDDVDSDDQQTLFQKESSNSFIKKNTPKDNQKNASMAAVKLKGVSQSCQDKCALFISPFVPGVISVNTLLIFHWICCVVVSYQVNFGWQDLVAAKPPAILSVFILASLLVVFSFLLWAQCGATAVTGFQVGS